LNLADFQDVIARTYGERGTARGLPAAVAWLAEEVGELAQAVRKGDRAARLHELADVLAWLTSIARSSTTKRTDSCASITSAGACWGARSSPRTPAN
jgi:NTP pyrophosphatase (non-canonical NTP hydrolase)